MAAGATLTARVDELIDLFNGQGMDLPDGLFDRRTQFRLNGTPFEELLGRPSNDPLVLMLTRGAAGYRFAVKGLQHAVPDARVQRGEVVEQSEAGRVLRITTQIWLSGHVRESGEAVDAVVDVVVEMTPAGTVAVADAMVEEGTLAKIREARLLP